MHFVKFKTTLSLAQAHLFWSERDLFEDRGSDVIIFTSFM